VERPDEKLARVTYLPGVTPPAPSGRAPSFVEMYGDPVIEPVEIRVDHSVIEPVEIRDRADDLARAENVSMHALTRRGQSRRELERTLRSRNLPDDIVEHEVERLEGVGLIDDVALAQNLVGVLQERKGLGRTGIAAELTRRMLSPAAISYALELVDTSDELSRAREIAVKRASQLTSYDRETAQRRLSAYLARRGYSGSTVRAAVDHALAGSPHPRNRSTGGVRFR